MHSCLQAQQAGTLHTSNVHGLSENRNLPTSSQQQSVKSEQEAERHRQQGNIAFAKPDYEGAAEHYTAVRHHSSIPRNNEDMSYLVMIQMILSYHVVDTVLA